MLRAGVAKANITPPVGVRMAGFAGRVFPALAVHDPLLARALVLDDGEKRAALVTLDIIGVSEGLVAEVRESAEKSAGIAPDGLLIAGTHTHSGPRRVGDDSSAEERGYWESLPGRLAQLVEEAARDLGPARMGTASGWCAVGINRREKLPGGIVELGKSHFGAFDTELGLLRFDREGGGPLAGIVNYACHAVCLMADNYLISADYPGFAAHYFQEAVGGGVVGMFFNGACGNVNPREAAVDHGLVSGGSFKIAERAGREVAREAARLWEEATPEEGLPLSFLRRRISLPTDRGRALAAAKRNLREAERDAAGGRPERTPYETWYDPADPERARKRVARLEEEGDSPVSCEIQVVAIGETALVGWPGEVFCELGMRLKRESGFRPTYVIGYANGSIGYVPTPEAFSEGGYEVESARHLADRAGTVLVEESLGLLAELGGSSG